MLDEEARKLSVRKLSMRKLSTTSNSIFSAIKEAVVGPQKQQQEMEGRKMSTVSNSIFSTIKDAMVGPSKQQDPEATLYTDHRFTHPSKTDGSGIVDFNKHAVISETEEEHHTPNRSKVLQLVLQIMLCILFLSD